MGVIIKASIDLNKLDKSKIIEGKNNAKYYNIDIFIQDEINQFNQNVSIANPTQSKEETKVYLGNGKVTYLQGEIKVVPKQETQQQVTKSEEKDDDSLPF